MNRVLAQYIVNQKGEKKAVILSIEHFQELMEDLHDLAIVAERKNEPTLSFKEIKKRLKKDGLL